MFAIFYLEQRLNTAIEQNLNPKKLKTGENKKSGHHRKSINQKKRTPQKINKLFSN